MAKLKDAGCTAQTIFREQISSVQMDYRIEFAKVLGVLLRDAVLVFTILSC